MMLAGVDVPGNLVLELAGLLRDGGFMDTADTLEHAYDSERRIVALSIASREAILRVLDDPSEGLAELRGVLLQKHEWRVPGRACLVAQACSDAQDRLGSSFPVAQLEGSNACSRRKGLDQRR
jgi:hypothetical protein